MPVEFRIPGFGSVAKLEKEKPSTSFYEDNKFLLCVTGAIAIGGALALYLKKRQNRQETHSIHEWITDVSARQKELEKVKNLRDLNNSDWHVPHEDEIKNKT